MRRPRKTSKKGPHQGVVLAYRYAVFAKMLQMTLLTIFGPLGHHLVFRWGSFSVPALEKRTWHTFLHNKTTKSHLNLVLPGCRIVSSPRTI